MPIDMLHKTSETQVYPYIRCFGLNFEPAENSPRAARINALHRPADSATLGRRRDAEQSAFDAELRHNRLQYPDLLGGECVALPGH